MWWWGANAAASVGAQDDGSNTFPLDYLGNILDSKGSVIPIEKLGRTVGLYFTAVWSPACRRFTSTLSNHLAERQNDLSIIYVSFDRSEETYQKGLLEADSSSMYRLPFDPSQIQTNRLRATRHALGLPSLPALVVCDRLERKVITTAGVPALLFSGRKAIDEWVSGRRGLPFWRLVTWRTSYLVSAFVYSSAVIAFNSVMDMLGLDNHYQRLRIRAAEEASSSASSSTTGSTSINITLSTTSDDPVTTTTKEEIKLQATEQVVEMMPKDKIIIEKLAEVGAIAMAAEEPTIIPRVPTIDSTELTTESVSDAKVNLIIERLEPLPTLPTRAASIPNPLSTMPVDPGMSMVTISSTTSAASSPNLDPSSQLTEAAESMMLSLSEHEGVNSNGGSGIISTSSSTVLPALEAPAIPLPPDFPFAISASQNGLSNGDASRRSSDAGDGGVEMAAATAAAAAVAMMNGNFGTSVSPPISGAASRRSSIGRSLGNGNFLHDENGSEISETESRMDESIVLLGRSQLSLSDSVVFVVHQSQEEDGESEI
ncbi:hypothetical protein HDU76_009817 [Blyttiomyces sp. JEL0837]|nr:hypothetical protein HDU76_009817 [Blyttiomyces sp. JEL0837]